MKNGTRIFANGEQNHMVQDSVYDIHLNEKSIYTKRRKRLLRSELIQLDLVHKQTNQLEGSINEIFHIEF